MAVSRVLLAVVALVSALRRAEVRASAYADEGALTLYRSFNREKRSSLRTGK